MKVAVIDNNVFRFSLHQENVLLCEEVFDADNFSPLTRYSIDIRDILPKVINTLQKALSKRNYETIIDVGVIDEFADDYDGELNQKYYDLYQHQLNVINSFPHAYRDELKYFPQVETQQVLDNQTQEMKTIRGVECKIGFYINDKPIVERTFYVDGFNPMARWSVDLIGEMNYIVDMIFYQIKRIDVRNIWDDYDLINVMGLTIAQIRELPNNKREEMIRRVKRINSN